MLNAHLNNLGVRVEGGWHKNFVRLSIPYHKTLSRNSPKYRLAAVYESPYSIINPQRSLGVINFLIPTSQRGENGVILFNLPVFYCY